MSKRKIPKLPSHVLLPPAGNLDTWLGLTKAHSKPKTPESAAKRLCVTDSSVHHGQERFRSRQDQPKCRQNGRLSGSMSEALGELENDFYASSSQAPRAALLHTWEKFHAAWFNDTTPAFPITAESLRCVSAMFKAGGYSSYKNYLFAAKAHDVRLGFVWTQSLAQLAMDCSRSVLRGVGTAKRSEPLEFEKALRVCGSWGYNFECACRPISSTALVLMGVLFMCREIEISGALSYELTVDPEVNACTLRLPVSKKGPEGRGTVRTVDCLCNFLNPCPVHFMFRYIRELKDFGRRLNIEADVLPLFPKPNGSVWRSEKLQAYSSKSMRSLWADGTPASLHTVCA